MGKDALMTPGRPQSPGSTGKADACRVFICDDQPDIRLALSEVLDGLSGFEKVGEAADGDGAIEGLRTTAVDLVILDVNMPGGGPQTAREIKLIRPSVKIVVFTAHRDDEMRAAMLAAGADDFVVKTGRLGPLRESMNRVVAAKSPN
jgi:DNA-binding NarL/FixJ family response regulator